MIIFAFSHTGTRKIVYKCDFDIPFLDPTAGRRLPHHLLHRGRIG